MGTKQEIKQVHYCDRLKCVKKQGIVAVRVEISQPDTDPLPVRWDGDLCPYHRRQLVDKVDAMFSRVDEVTPEPAVPLEQ